MSHLLPCPHCQRHLRAMEIACPFCGKQLPQAMRASAPAPTPRTRLPRAALFVFGASLLGAPACDDDAENNNGADGSVNAGGSGGASNNTGGTGQGGGSGGASQGGNGGGGKGGTGGGNAGGAGGGNGGAGQGGNGGGVAPPYGLPAPLYGAPVPS